MFLSAYQTSYHDRVLCNKFIVMFTVKSSKVNSKYLFSCFRIRLLIVGVMKHVMMLIISNIRSQQDLKPLTCHSAK